MIRNHLSKRLDCALANRRQTDVQRIQVGVAGVGEGVSTTVAQEPVRVVLEYEIVAAVQVVPPSGDAISRLRHIDIDS
jgi:hypothetical protein